MNEETPLDMPPPPPDHRPPALFSRRIIWLSIAGGLVLALGVWLVLAKLPRLLTTPQGDQPAQTAPAVPGDTRKIHVTLFYVAESGSELVLSNAEVPFGETPAEQARRIVEAQVQPPPEGTFSAIPAGTKVRAVYLSPRGEAYVDLSSDVSRGHTGGSLSEALAVFAIVNVVTVNLPDITAVQILIDGKETDTLAGHIDLRHPLKRALEWVRR